MLDLVLDRAAFESDILHPFTCIPRLFHNRTRPDVLELAPDKGTALARFHVLEVDELDQLPVDLQHHAIAKISCCRHFTPLRPQAVVLHQLPQFGITIRKELSSLSP